MCPSGNNSREIANNNGFASDPMAANHRRNGDPDLGRYEGTTGGFEIGAALSWGRERPRCYDYSGLNHHQYFATAQATSRRALPLSCLNRGQSWSVRMLTGRLAWWTPRVMPPKARAQRAAYYDG